MKTWLQLSFCLIFFSGHWEQNGGKFPALSSASSFFHISIVVIYSTVIRLQGSWEIQVLDMPFWPGGLITFDTKFENRIFDDRINMYNRSAWQNIDFILYSFTSKPLTFLSIFFNQNESKRQAFSSKFYCFDSLCFVCWVVGSWLHTPAWSALLSIYFYCLGEEACSFVYLM